MPLLLDGILFSHLGARGIGGSWSRALHGDAIICIGSFGSAAGIRIRFQETVVDAIAFLYRKVFGA
jgi:hypothetical protein